MKNPELCVPCIMPSVRKAPMLKLAKENKTKQDKTKLKAQTDIEMGKYYGIKDVFNYQLKVMSRSRKSVFQSDVLWFLA